MLNPIWASFCGVSVLKMGNLGKIGKEKISQIFSQNASKGVNGAGL